MKSFNRYAILILLGLGLLSCSKDPDVVIYDQIEFDQCLAPVEVRFKVENVSVTVNCEKSFPDAEKFELEVYSEPLPADDEVNDTDLIKRDVFEEFPYTFIGPDETPCYMRLRAINELAGKKPSRWTCGYVMTGVDPEHTCVRPADAKAVATYTSVKFSWTQAANVKQYEIEIYKEPMPTSGEPFKENLYCPKIVKSVTEIPFTMEFPIRKFYYRVRGINEEDGLKPSSWVRGSFATSAYEWPVNKDAFDYGYTPARPRTSTVSAEAFAAAGWAPGDKVPADTEYTVDGITYGPDVLFESAGDRVTLSACNSWDKTNYARNFPLNRYLRFDVNKPGSLSFIVRLSGSTSPKLFVAVKTTKMGVTTFSYLSENNVTVTPTIKEKNEENRVTIDVTRDALMGIDDAATVYVFGGVAKISLYPITWTPAANE
ncbi:MAG: hypothetical protein J5737_04140 [Bacteroidales bacterium]|nr:hypothetical protein [Bacteroidales bacterium]